MRGKESCAHVIHVSLLRIPRISVTALGSGMGSFRLREFRAPLGQRLRATCEQEMVGGQQFQKQDRARHI